MPTLKEILTCALIFIIPALIALPFRGQLQKLKEEKEAKVSPWIKSYDFFKDKDVLWIDARNEKKFQLKHIPGAVNLSQYDWEGGLERLFTSEKFAANPDVMMVIYCNKGCHDSEAVATRLREELQKDNIYILKGGMHIWFESQQ